MVRFWAKVNKTGECWEWQGARDPSGYGRFQVGTNQRPQTVLAHRFAYELEVGPIPIDSHLHHECHNQACVRPSHLRPLGHVDHVAAHPRQRMSHCKRGHEFTEQNTLWLRSGRLRRSCRACAAQRRRAFSARAVRG